MFRKYINNPHFPFWLIAFSTIIVLTVPILIKDGMFMDGMLYTCVSHNLSRGIGTFWFPQFSSYNMAGLTSFHEQPPLAFGIQALFFKILGDSMYTERIYIFFTLCISAWLLYLLWKKIPVSDEQKKMGWLAIILWITIPINFWAFSNNMIENTMGIFTLAAGLLIFISLDKGRFGMGAFLLPGFFIFLATFTKGVPGFFPVTFPFLYWLSTRKIKITQCILPTIVLLLVPVILYGILLLFPQSRESLSMYFFDRLLGRINNQSSVDNRFQIIGHIFTQLLPQLIFLALILLISVSNKTYSLIPQSQKRLALFFILAGIAGSAPIALTKVQCDFYFNPSLPFYAIGFSLLTAPFITRYVSKINIKTAGYKIFTLISGSMLVSVIFFSALQVGKYSRHKELLHDVYIVGKVVPVNSIVSVPPTMWGYWELQCYLIRYFNISIDPKDEKQYYLLARELHQAPPLHYKKLDEGLLEYDLFVHE